MRSTLALLISIQVFSLTLAEEDPEVDIFAVRRTSSNIRSQPAFEHTNAHAGEMPLARILVSTCCTCCAHEIQYSIIVHQC